MATRTHIYKANTVAQKVTLVRKNIHAFTQTLTRSTRAQRNQTGTTYPGNKHPPRHAPTVALARDLFPCPAPATLPYTSALQASIHPFSYTHTHTYMHSYIRAYRSARVYINKH